MRKRVTIFFTAALIAASIPPSAKATPYDFTEASSEKQIADSITVAGRIRNIEEGMPRTLIINECDPWEKSERAICELDSSGSFSRKIPFSFPHTFTVNYDRGNFINVFAAPGDSVFMDIDASVSPLYVEFSADRQEINRQYNQAFQQMSELYWSRSLPSDTVPLEEYMKVFKEYVREGRDSIDSYATVHNLSSEVVSMLNADNIYSLANSALGYCGQSDEEKRAFFLDPIFDIFNEDNTKVMLFPYHISAVMSEFPDVLESAPKGTIRDIMYVCRTDLPAPDRSEFFNCNYYDRVYGRQPESELSVRSINSGSMTVYVDGELRNLSDVNPIAWLIKECEGAAIYLDVSATWCGPCRAGLSGSESLREHFRDSDVKFAVMWLRSEKEDWVKVAPTISNAIQIFVDDTEMDDRITGYLDISGFPSYLMIDKEGNITNDGVPHYLSPELPEFLGNFNKQRLK
ncbi:MAG: hypothetical protein HDS54_07515 [Barnesiella sp.]|nr:hypothetical protein [Barnesiella sp.]